MILELRDLRARVKNIASLVGGGYGISERMADRWACDLEERVIFWRANSPIPPFDPIPPEHLLYLIGHEAAHLRYTSLYDTPVKANADRFARLVNAVEDIRINRLMAGEFARYHDFQVQTHVTSEQFHRQNAEGYSRFDAVTLSWPLMEEGYEPIGQPADKRFATALWERISYIANAGSTTDLARALEPVYWLLHESNPDPQALPAPSAGGNQPSDSPSKSNRGSQAPLDDLQVLKGVMLDAGDQGTQIALAAVIDDEEQQRLHAAFTSGMTGDMSPHQRSYPNLAAWQSARDDVRPYVNLLARRLERVLRANESDDWQPDLRRGQLDASAARRSLSGDVAVFREREEPGARDHAFFLLVDRSTSQSKRIRDVLRAVVLVAEALDRASLRFSVIPWSTHVEPVKRLRDPLNDAQRASLGGSCGTTGGGTYEAIALMLADEQIGRARSANSDVYVITITDGKTTQVGDSVAMIDSLEAKGARCIAISIACPEARHYPVSMRVNDAKSLLKVLPEVIGKTVRRV